MSQKRLLFLQFQFLFLHLCVQQYKRTTVINNNINPEGPGPFNLIFSNQLKWAPTILYKWAPYNNIDLGGPGPPQFNFGQPTQMGPLQYYLNGPPTKILI